MKKSTLLMALAALALLCLMGGALYGDFTIRAVGPCNNDPKLIIDGGVLPNGASWDSEACVWWTDAKTYFIIDLGEVLRIEDILIQADNNDTYQLEFSRDGKVFNSLTRVEMDHGTVDYGMDTFSSEAENPAYVDALDFQPAEARYIKIQALEGDDSFSVSEIQINTNPL